MGFLKTGSAGLGYSRDGVAAKQTLELHRLIRPLAELEPVVLPLDDILATKSTIGDPLLATSEDNGGKDAKNAARSKKTRSRVAVAINVESEGKTAGDFFDEFESELTCKLNDCSHRERGMWAFDTVNPNAWPGAAEF